MSTLILDFPTKQEADNCLVAIKALAEAWWVEQGYKVENGELIDKVNGVDAPQNQRTTKCADAIQSPDNTYYFTSLTNNPQFPDWKTMLSDIGFTNIGMAMQLCLTGQAYSGKNKANCSIV